MSVFASPIARWLLAARRQSPLRLVARLRAANFNSLRPGGGAYRRWASFAAVFAAAWITVIPARAQNGTWTGTTSGDWTNGANWSPATPTGGPSGTATFSTSARTDVTFSTAPTALETIQINTGSSSYSFDLSGQTLTVNTAIADNSAATVSFSNGTIAGGGSLLMAGAGTLILSAGGTYTGNTEVLVGTLQVDGPLASRTVYAEEGGTLSGVGNIGPSTGGTVDIYYGGTLAPGTPSNPTGTLTVTGNVNFSAASDFAVTFNGAGSHSSVTATGSFNTNSAIFTAVSIGGTYAATDTNSTIAAQYPYTVVTATGGVSSTFSGISVSGNFGNVVPILNYNGAANNTLAVGFTAGTPWIGGSGSTATDWNTGSNWGTGAQGAADTVPTGFGDTSIQSNTVATFGSTGSTNVIVNAGETVGTMLFTSGAPQFTFTINGGNSLTLNGVGIDTTNNPGSSVAPVFVVGSTSSSTGALQFENSATAGNAVINISSGSSTSFYDYSTAGTATISNNGSLNFNTYSTAGNATITTGSGATTSLSDYSTGGSATFVTNGTGVLNFSSRGPNPGSPEAVSVGAIEGTGTGAQVELGYDIVTITAGAGSFAGVISGSGNTDAGNGGLTSLVIAGGTTTLSGTNTYTGATLITGGTLALAGGSIAASSGVTVNSGGTLMGTGSLPGVTVNAGGTLEAGTTTLTPGTGTTPTAAQTLVVNGNLALASGANYEVTVAGSNYSTTSVTGTASVAGVFTAVADGGIYVTSSPYAVLTATKGVSGTFSGLNVSGSFGDLVPVLTYGPATGASYVDLTLTSGNVWTDTAATSKWNNIDNWSLGTVPNASSTTPANTVATFENNGATTAVTIDTAATVGSMLFTSSAPQFTFAINGSNNSLTLSGVGVVNNSSFAPIFNVGGSSGAGTLTFEGAANAGNAILNVGTGGVVDFSGSLNPNLTAGSINDISSVGGSIYLGSNTLTIADGGTFGGIISNCGTGGTACNASGATGGSLIISGGTLTLSGVNTYTGGTTIDAGATLTLTASGSIAASSSVVDNGTFTISAATSIGGLSGTNTSATVNLGGNTLTITGGNGSFAGAINGAGGALTLDAPGGTLKLSGNNTYTGGTTLTAGTLNVGSNTAVGTNTLTFNGGTLQAGGNFTIADPGAVNTSGGTIDANGNFFTYSGLIANGNGTTGGLTIMDSANAGGIVALTNANTYSGGTTIDSGATLRVTDDTSATANSLGAGTLTFNGGTLQAGAAGLSFSNAATLGTAGGTFDSNGTTLTWGGTIGGAGGLMVTDSLGTGTLILSNTNGYTGATTVNSGTLEVDGSIATSSGVAVNSGGTLSGTGTVPTVTVASGGTLAPGSIATPTGTLNIAGNLTLASGSNYAVTITDTTGVNSAVALTTATGVASLSGIFTAVATAGTYSTSDTYTVLSTTNARGVSGTFSGGLAVSGSFGDYVPLLTYNANDVVMGFTQGTLWSSTAATTDWNTGANWQSGSVPSSTGVAAFNTSSQITVTVSVPTQIGTMLFYATTADIFTFDINSSLALTGIGIVDNGTTQKFSVAGTLEFENAATAGGAGVAITTTSGGKTEFLGNSNGGSAAFVTTGTGVIDFSGTTGPMADGNVAAGSINGTSGFIYLGSNTLTLSADSTYGGIISDCGTGNQCNGNANGRVGGSLILVGTHALPTVFAFSGASTYTGGTTVDQYATLQIAGNPNYVTTGVPSSGILNSPIGTGILTLNGGTLQSGPTTATGSPFTVVNAIQITAAGGIIDANGNTFTLSGVIADAPAQIGALQILDSSGGGTVVFSGLNSYSGTTVIGDGTHTVTLQGGATDAFSPNSKVVVTSTGTLDLNGYNQTIAALSGSSGSAIVTNSGQGTGVAATLTIDGASGVSTSFSGVIENGTATGGGALSLVKNGSSTQVLAGANTYTGGTTLSGGILQVDVATVGSPGSITSSAIGKGTLTFNGGTLQASAASLTIANAGQITANGGTIDANGHTFTYSGNIGDAASSSGGALNIIDSSATAGTVIFSGTNTYSGETIVGGTNAVTLKGGNTDAFSANSTVTVNTGSTLDLGGFSQVIGGLAGAGTVLNNGSSNATLSVGGNDATTTFSGIIENGTSKTTALTLTGGTLTLSGTDTYTGATTVSGGNLSVTGEIASSSGVSVSSGGALSGTGTINTSVTIGTVGTLSPGTISNPTGTLTITGNLTLTATSDYVATIVGSSNSATNVTATSGTDTLAGTLTAIGANVIAGSYTVLTDTVGFTGKFSGLSISGSFGNLVPFLDYSSPDAVVLDLTAGNIWKAAATGNWNNTGNWTLGTVPNASSSTPANTVATFENNGAPTSVTIDTAATAGTLLFASGAPQFTFTINGANSLTLSGIGIDNNSSNAPIFNVGGATAGTLTFLNAATAGNAIINNGSVTGGVGGQTIFGTLGGTDTATAGSANITNNNLGVTTFNAYTTAGAATITTNSGGSTRFFDHSTGGNATFFTNGTGVLDFSGTSGPNSDHNITAGAIEGTGGGTIKLGANILALTAATGSFSGTLGAVGDGGGLTIAAGTQTLSGVTANYTGATTINSGATLILTLNGSTATTFAGLSNVVDNGTFNISGNGSNTSIGALSGTNAAASVVLGANTLTITAGGGSFAGVISGTGGIVIALTSGTQTLSGTNTYTGPTTINSGTLALAGTGSIAPSSGVLLGSNTSFFDISGTSSGASITKLTSNFSSSAVNLGTQTLTLTNAGGTFAGAINGSTGGLTIAGGNFQLDNGGSINITTSPGAATVNSGATFSGIGNVTAPNVNVLAGGTLAPGSTSTPTGTLAITGNLTLASASYYMVAINGANASNTTVSGTATLNGATLLVTNAGTGAGSGIKLSTPYTLLTAGTVTGTLTKQGAYASTNYGPVQATLTYPGNTAVVATFSHAQLNVASLPPGFQSFGNALNAASNNGALAGTGNTYLGLFDVPSAGTLGQATGLSNLGSIPALANMQSSFGHTMINHPPTIGGGVGGGVVGGPALSFAPPIPQTPAEQAAYSAVTPSNPFQAMMQQQAPPATHSAWASAYGGYASLTGASDVGSPTATTGGAGFAGGVDFRLTPDTVIGFALGGGYTSWSLSNNLGGGNSDIFQAGFYGSQRFGNAYLAGSIAYAFDAMNTSRNVIMPGVSSNITGKFDAQGGDGRLEGGYRFATAPDVGITPYLAGELNALHSPSYSETSTGTSGYALSYGAQTTTDTRAEAGVWVDKAFHLANNSTLFLAGKAGYAHDWWSNDFLTANFTSLPTVSFTQAGLTPPSNIGLASVVSEVRYLNGMSFGIRLDGEIASGAYSLAAQGTFRYTW